METICIDIIFGLLYMFRKKFTTKQGWKPVWSCFRDSYLLFAQFWAGVSFSKVRLTISLIIGKSAEDRINSFNLCLFSEKPRLHILVKDVTRWDVNKVGTMWLAKIICSHKTQGDFFQPKRYFLPSKHPCNGFAHLFFFKENWHMCYSLYNYISFWRAAKTFCLRKVYRNLGQVQ